MDYLSRFDFDITYIKGELNKIADCLSQYYESNATDKIHNINEYVCADAWIDPEGEDLSLERYHEVVERVIEIRAMQEVELWRSHRLLERNEERNIEAEDMAENVHQPSKAAGTQATHRSGNVG